MLTTIALLIISLCNVTQHYSTFFNIEKSDECGLKKIKKYTDGINVFNRNLEKSCMCVNGKQKASRFISYVDVYDSAVSYSSIGCIWSLVFISLACMFIKYNNLL